MTSTSQPVRVAMIGCGGFARHHLRRMLPLAQLPAHPGRLRAVAGRVCRDGPAIRRTPGCRSRPTSPT